MDPLEEHFRNLALTEGTLSNSAFQIDPPTYLVDLYFEKEGDSSTKQKVSLDEDDKGVVNLANYSCNCSYSVEVYSRGTNPRLLLHKFRFTKNSDGSIDVHYVDVAATVIETVFKSNDVPLEDAEVSGNFVGADGKTCNLTGKTEPDGSFLAVLPHGTVSGFKAKKGTKEVSKNTPVIIPPPPPSTPGNLRKKNSIMIEVKPSSFAGAVNPSKSNAFIAILGDISGSMCAVGQMEILRKSFIDIFDKAVTKGWTVVMAAWDAPPSPVEWCCGGTVIQSSQRGSVVNWANSLKDRGGNEMRRAISEAISKHPALTDVYTMCDGDVSPFNRSSWSTFRAGYPEIIFHFVALGRGASFAEMNNMAIIGNGTFWEESK